VKSPHDQISGLPDKRAFDLNLAAMLALGRRNAVGIGVLLLIRMDKADAVGPAGGSANVEKLLGRLISVICGRLAIKTSSAA